jgi:hypothetical protein
MRSANLFVNSFLVWKCVNLIGFLYNTWLYNKHMNEMITYNRAVPPYPQVIRSKTYRGYVKPRIIPNAIYNVKFV